MERAVELYAAVNFFVIGLSQVLKAFIAFVFPSVGARGIARVRLERDWEFAIGGVLFLALSALMVYLATRG